MTGDMAGAEASAAGVLRVAVDCPLRTLLDYLPPPGESAQGLPLGARVRVPFGTRSAIGVIVAQAQGSALPGRRLKAITALLDREPLLAADLLELLQWTASYYHHPPGEVIAAAIPAALRAGQSALAQEPWLEITAAGLRANLNEEPRRAPRQRELLKMLADSAAGISLTQLDALAPGARPAARAISKRGWSRFTARAAGESTATPVPTATPRGVAMAAAPELSAAQSLAVEAIDAAAGRYGAFLLHGAPGSGKTEVYLRAVARCLERGANALVLVPEIGLTPQLLERFRARLPVRMAVLHSALSDGERLAAWREARSGRARVVIGTRSAVFAPIPGLGLITVDEEHDSSSKHQEAGCRHSDPAWAV